MIACTSTVSAMLHRYRCRYPGCESRRTDAHHVRHWAHGGETSLDNLISLCRRHHTTVHDTDVSIVPENGTFGFYLADGTPVPATPGLPGGSIDGLKDSHDAALEWHAIIPPHSGERLDLHEAIWICLHNLKLQAREREQDQHDQQQRWQTEYTPAT